MTSTKNEEDLIKSFELLSIYINGFEKGEILLYLPMAVELRKLLCEKEPSPLIIRVTSEFKLHKLHFTEIIENTPSLLDGLQNIFPGRLSVNENRIVVFNLLFSNSIELMSIDDWVNQRFFNEAITIKELIKSVADKEAAHADVNYNETLIHCKSWSFNDVNSHILGIYGISKYLSSLYENEYKNL